VFRTLILIPWIIPPAIAAVVWKWIYSEQDGILNHILLGAGVIDHPVAWLATPDMAMWAVIAVGIWKGTPFVAICLLAGLQTIPITQYEAALVDGARSFRRFWHITMPHLRSISFIALILTTIWNVNQFALTHILTRGGPGHTTQILSTYAYQLFFTAFDLGHSAAVATVMLIIMMGLTSIYVRRTLQQPV
jgi:multiple sugar transport system permease protein